MCLISLRSIAAKVLPWLLRERGRRWRLTMARAASGETLRRLSVGMIDPEVTTWCPRGDHADSGLLRCFGGADGVVFGAAPSFGKRLVIRLVVSRLLGRAPRGWQPGPKAASGWLMDN